MKKMLSVILAGAMAATMLTACGGGSAATKETAAKETAAQAAETKADAKADAAGDEKVYKIGAIQFVEHAALDAAYKGFIEGLDEAGIKYEIELENAQSEQANCETIATKLVNDQCDLILAIATPAAQAVAAKTSDIPVLVTAVTDPAGSGLVASNEAPGGNISGTSDLTPVKEQIDLLQKLVPDAKSVGVLTCSKEDNSIIQVKMAKEAIEAAGMECKEYTVADSNEIQSVVESMVGKVDVLYAPTDNTIAAGMSTVTMVANANNLPCIVGEEGMVENGGLATYGINYENLGKKTAQMAVEILKNGKNPADMPIEYLLAADCELSVNDEAAKELGIEIPADLK